MSRTPGRRQVLVLKTVVWVVGLSPALWLVWAASADHLGANPIEKVIHVCGRWTLVFLFVTLAVTPLRRITGWNPAIKARRPLGLFTFFYASLHFLSYAGLDQFFALPYIVEDVLERPYITVGFLGFVLLVPLAITSTKGWIRRLGRRWQILHRLVYVTAGLGVLHFYWKVKADTLWPLVAAGVLVALFAHRVAFARKKRREAGVRRRSAPEMAGQP